MRFVKESRIAAPPSVVFAFHESPDALQRLSGGDGRVAVLAGGGSLRPGSRVVLKVALGPFSFRWVAEHTQYEAGRLFVDRQVQGPFAHWEHRHLFVDDGQGGTTLRDEVDYEVPCGWIGRLLGGRLVDRILHRVFASRHEVTRRIIESGEFSPPDRSASEPSTRIAVGASAGPGQRPS